MLAVLLVQQHICNIAFEMLQRFINQLTPTLTYQCMLNSKETVRYQSISQLVNHTTHWNRKKVCSTLLPLIKPEQLKVWFLIKHCIFLSHTWKRIQPQHYRTLTNVTINTLCAYVHENWAPKRIWELSGPNGTFSNPEVKLQSQCLMYPSLLVKLTWTHYILSKKISCKSHGHCEARSHPQDTVYGTF